jgi:hypothetical protein
MTAKVTKMPFSLFVTVYGDIFFTYVTVFCGLEKRLKRSHFGNFYIFSASENI